MILSIHHNSTVAAAAAAAAAAAEAATNTIVAGILLLRPTATSVLPLEPTNNTGQHPHHITIEKSTSTTMMGFSKLTLRWTSSVQNLSSSNGKSYNCGTKSAIWSTKMLGPPRKCGKCCVTLPPTHAPSRSKKPKNSFFPT